MTSETQNCAPRPCIREHPQTPDNINKRGWCKKCASLRAKKYYEAHKDKITASRRAQRSADIDRARAKDRGNYLRHAEARKEYSRAWRAANKEHATSRDAEYRAQVRDAVFDAYGWSCACCSDSVPRFLTIDHVNGNGSEHRKLTGPALHRTLRREGYPEGYRTLCSSCNAGRHINGGLCPHVAPITDPVSDKQRYYRRLKVAATEAYGGNCACCGEDQLPFLTIDHVNNDGNEHRLEIPAGGGSTYRWLRNNNWPTGFQVLCWNCNDGKHWNGGVCPHLSA